MILYVEDDDNIRELVVYTLESTGFNSKGVPDGKAMDQVLLSEKPELILLDIMLPGEDGISILQRLRKAEDTKRIPIIMMTAKGTEYDKVIGLDTGADDYITKPFGMMELISRVKALLRRTNSEESTDSVIRIGELSIDHKKREVKAFDKTITLTLKEYELLYYLMKNPNIVLTRDKLLESVWGYDFGGETRTVDVHIRTLRGKLNECGDMIETIRGVGYRIKK
ncbi:MAG: winged helix-turn-helix domain-containing protein [Suipraeoptans sp.]